MSSEPDVESLSDRELDALVAERVMGWRWFHCEADTGSKRNQFCSPETIAIWRTVGWVATPLSAPPDSDQFSDASNCPHYVSDIASAFQVVEKMQRPCRRIIIEMDRHGWEVDVKYQTGDGWFFLARRESDTLPRAICLAALAAIQATASTASVAHQPESSAR